MTPPCSRPSWPTSRRSVHRLGGGALGPARFMPARVMTAGPTGPGCAARGQGADRSAADRVVSQAWTQSLEGRAFPVLAELLQAATGAMGPGCRAVVRVRAGGLCAGVLQPALTGQKE